MADDRDLRSSELKPHARSGHVACSIGNIMLVWGGFNEVTEPWLPQERYMSGSDVWVYHTVIGQWFCKKTTGDTPTGTSGASVVVIDHMMYLVGGHTIHGNTNMVYGLDLHQWDWTCLDTGDDDHRKMSPRDKFVIWEYQNRIYVFGGFGIPTNSFLSEHGEFYPDASTYNSPVRGWNNQLMVLNPVEGMWSNPLMSGPAPSPRAAHTAIRLQNKVFIFGGRHSAARLNDLHCLDLEKQRWSGELQVHGDIPKGRSWHSLTAISDTHAVLYGGYTQTNTPLSDGWLLDSTTLQWSQLELPTNRPRLWHTAVRTSEHEVLIFGGSMNDILGSDETEHSNDMILLRCVAKSLLRLCIDAAYQHRALLQGEWKSLPKHLHQILELRTEGYDVQNDSPSGHNTKACVIS